MHGRAKPQESDQSSRTIAGERLPRPQDGQIVDCCPKRTADGVPYKPYAPQPSDTCYVSYDGSISAVRSDTVLTGQHRSMPGLSGSRGVTRAPGPCLFQRIVGSAIPSARSSGAHDTSVQKSIKDGCVNGAHGSAENGASTRLPTRLLRIEPPQQSRLHVDQYQPGR